MAGELDPRTELRLLTEALLAHAEWQQACGAGALPTATADERRLREGQDAPVELVGLELASASRSAADALGAARLGAPAAPVAAAAASAAPASLSLSVEERHTRLTVLAETVKGCTRCSLHEARTQTVFARGAARRACAS